MHISILGAGRMGSYIAQKLPRTVTLTIIDKQEAAAQKAAAACHASWSTLPEGVQGSHFVFALLPTEVMTEALREILPHLEEDSVIVNMATTALTEDLRRDVLPPDCPVRIHSAKIIGHYREMALGEKALIVIDQDADEDTKDHLAYLLSEAGQVIFGPADEVARINTIASEEGIRASLRIARRLREMGLSGQWIEAAIRVPGSGTMKAHAMNDLGPFARELARKIEEELALEKP